MNNSCHQNNISPIELVQNPAHGAQVLWNFGRNTPFSIEGGISLLSYFLILPLVLNRQCLEKIRSTNPSSSFATFIAKFNKNKEQLLSIHQRCLSMRQLTLESIAIGTQTKLFSVDYKTAQIICYPVKFPRPSASLKPHFDAAVKLGLWFSQLTEIEIFNSLQVAP